MEILLLLNVSPNKHFTQQNCLNENLNASATSVLMNIFYRKLFKWTDSRIFVRFCNVYSPNEHFRSENIIRLN